MDRTYALMQKIGQSPVRVMKEIDGFALNRLQYAVISEAWRLVEVCGQLPASGSWRERWQQCPGASWGVGSGWESQKLLVLLALFWGLRANSSLKLSQQARKIKGKIAIHCMFPKFLCYSKSLIFTPDDRLLCFLPSHIITA